ncbi:hypothetical protein ACC676_38730, partial [Rhizobium ruizarguesonis]
SGLPVSETVVPARVIWIAQNTAQTTTVTNSSFITGIYVVFVPLIAVFFLRRAPHWIIWPGALMEITGIYLLSGGQLSAMAPGDLLTVV